MSKKVKYRCQVPGCSSTNLSRKHLYRFPKDEKRCRIWVDFTNNPKLLDKTASDIHELKICEDHFAEWCFMNVQDKSRLVHNAVPGVLHKTDSPLQTFSQMHLNTVSFDSLNTIDQTPVMSDQTPVMSDQTPVMSDQTPMMTDQTPMMTDPTPMTSTSAAAVTPSISKIASGRKKYTPVKSRMAKIIKKKNDALRRLRRKTQHVQNILSSQGKTKLTFLKQSLTEANVDEKLITFILRQVKLSSLPSQSRRFSDDEKIFAYRLLCKSRAAYRVLSTLLEMPSESTLRRFLASKWSESGIDMNIINSLRIYAQNKPLEDRLFSLIFDEMSIKPQLMYNICGDNISGFQDFGKLGRSEQVANQALVFMLKNLKHKQKLPICYFFSNGPVSSSNLKLIVEELVDKVKSVNIVVKSLICDQGSSNCRLFSLLNITKDHPYFERNDTKIFGIFDPPHLLKTLRRNLMKYDLETSKGIVSFSHIIKFYQKDQERSRKAAPKLTDRHINAEGLNSMKVSLAAQIFSNTVSSGMSLFILGSLLPSESAATAEFVGQINDLFDSTNGASLKPLRGKPFHCSVKEGSPHIPFWEKLLQDMSRWKFIHKTDHTEPKPCKRRKLAELKSKSGWLLTLNSMIGLCRELKNCGFKFVMPRRLNQDCLENFFSSIRNVGGNNKNPTAFEFSSFFKIATINCLTKVKKFKNCEDDCDMFFLDLIKCSSSKYEINLDENDFENLPSSLQNLEISESNDEKYDFIEENVMAYLAGYIARRVLDGIDCSICIKALKSEKELRDETMYIYFKEYFPFDFDNTTGLYYPTTTFFACFSNMMQICDKVFENILHKDNLLQNLKLIVKEHEKLSFLDVCSAEHKHKLISNIYDKILKLAIKIHLRELNRCIEKKVFDLKKVRDIIKKKQINSVI